MVCVCYGPAEKKAQNPPPGGGCRRACLPQALKAMKKFPADGLKGKTSWEEGTEGTRGGGVNTGGIWGEFYSHASGWVRQPGWGTCWKPVGFNSVSTLRTSRAGRVAEHRGCREEGPVSASGDRVRSGRSAKCGASEMPCEQNAPQPSLRGAASRSGGNRLPPDIYTPEGHALKRGGSTAPREGRREEGGHGCRCFGFRLYSPRAWVQMLVPLP